MAINIGDIVYHDYGEVPRTVHARLVVGVIDETTFEYQILTPDLDSYVEICHTSNPDLRQFYPPRPGGGLPVGVRAASVYAFAPMSAADYARHLNAGRATAALERQQRGLVAAAGVPAAPAVAGNQIWVMAECCGSHKIGEQVQPPAGFPTLGEFGLVNMSDLDGNQRPCIIKCIDPDTIGTFCEERINLARNSESVAGDDRAAADDIRTMSVKYTGSGERRRGFKETVGELYESEMSDFPYEPRTCLEYLRAVATVAESSYAQHLSWIHQSKIPDGARAAYEDETLSHILDVAISYDCLCVSNLACFELLVRRKQLLAEAHSYNPASPNYEGSEYWMGNKFKHGGAIVIPSLTEHVAKRLHADSQIMKERRKLEEAKGKAKGGKPPKVPPKAPGAAGSGS